MSWSRREVHDGQSPQGVVEDKVVMGREEGAWGGSVPTSKPFMEKELCSSVINGLL